MSEPIYCEGRIVHDSERPVAEKYELLLNAADYASETRVPLGETIRRMRALRQAIAHLEGKPVPNMWGY